MAKKIKENINLNIIMYSSNDVTTDSQPQNIMFNFDTSNKKIKKVIV